MHGNLLDQSARTIDLERTKYLKAAITYEGTQRIFEACENAGTSAPVIDYKPNDLWIEFPFSPQYLKAIATPEVTDPVTAPVTDPVHRVVFALAAGEMAPSALWIRLGLTHRPTFRENYLRPALAQGLIEPTLPDKPNSRLQKYRLTEKGRSWLSRHQT